MARERKPTWVVPGPGRPGRWRTKIDGKVFYAPANIGRDDKPSKLGIPLAAWDWLRELEDVHRTPELGAISLRYLCNAYLDSAEAFGATKKYLQSRACLLGRFLDFRNFGERDAATLTAGDLDAFFQSLDDLAVNTRASIGTTIRTVFNWGARAIGNREPEKLLASNPIDGYRFPNPNLASRGYVEADVFRRLFRFAWGQARHAGPSIARFDRLFILMLQFQRLTGCRPGEARGLRWSDIQWSRGRIIIPPDRHKTGKKTHKERVIHIGISAPGKPSPVVRLLRAIERLDGRHPEYVFTCRQRSERRVAVRGWKKWQRAGQPWTGHGSPARKLRLWREQARALQKEARAKHLPDPFPGLEHAGPRKLVAYLTRHAYVSNAVAEGFSDIQTAQLVGNTPAIVAKVYAHAIDERTAVNAARLMQRGRGRA